MKVRLWLTIVDGNSIMGNSKLWYRDLETNQAPTVGDRVILWGDEEDGPLGGPLWDIKRRYWDADGGINVELARLIVDPDDRTRQMMRNAGARGDYDEQPWWTASDGRPETKLEVGGWSHR